MAASSTPSRKKSLTWLVPASLGAGALALSLVTGSLGAFTASIQNDNNTAGAGNLVMTETWTPTSGDPVVCSSSTDASNSVNCSTINKYGGNNLMLPGDTAETTIKLQHSGSVNAKTATLKAGACTPTTPTGKSDLCDKLRVVITEEGTTTPLHDGTPRALAGKGAITLKAPASQGSVNYTIKVELPADTTNNYAGTSLKQALTWTYSA